ncbi:MAG TPA: condensation domain-containing protein, partial [Pyrinomonadaceae bacterium]|nr:condensation domain-containing protein [Pyrinomonadaceae bacterium]
MSALDNYQRRNALSVEKRLLLEQRLRGLKGPAASAIPRREPNETPLASFAQQRLWFLDQLFPGNSFYNIPVVLPISTGLHPPLLRRCLNEIVG